MGFLLKIEKERNVCLQNFKRPSFGFHLFDLLLIHLKGLLI